MNLPVTRRLVIIKRSFIQQSHRKCSTAVGHNTDMKPYPWRDSATLLIVAPAPSLNFLVMKRSKGSTVGPGAVVFPGGTVSSADSSKRWLDMYKASGLDLRNPKFFASGAHKPFIYTGKIQNNKNDASVESSDSISIEVSLRITAIREMFEECGILLCKPIENNNPTLSNGEECCYQFPELNEKINVTEWQKKSRKDDKEFLNLCETLSCVPDLYALKDWNNWLTPTTFNYKARFNTMFYITVLSHPLPITIDEHEVESAKWETAEALLSEHYSGNIHLMPPQLYEFTRLKNTRNISELNSLLDKRKELGIGLYFPVVVALKDGLLFLMPGDDLYPKEPDIYTSKDKEELPGTIEEYRNSSTNLHRAEITADKNINYSYKCNIPYYGQYYS